MHDQDRVVDDRAHQDQEAQHGNHIKGLHDGGQADHWQQAANSVQHPQPDDATGNTQRNRGHDQQWVAPVVEDGHHQQVNDQQGNQVVAQQRLAGGVQLVGGAGDRDIHIRRDCAALAQVVNHFRAHPRHPGLQWYLARGNDIEGDRAAAIYPAHHAAADGLRDVCHRAQRQHFTRPGIQRQACQGIQRGILADVAVQVDVDLVVIHEKLIHVAAVGQCRHGESQGIGGHIELGGARPARPHFHHRLCQCE